MTTSPSSLVNQVYSPGSLGGEGFRLEDWVSGAQIRYYGMGRHTFLAALRIAGIARGDHVLIPEFICREMLAPLHFLGAIPIFYAIERDNLRPRLSPETPRCKAVLAIDYFGFAQNLSPFREYCDRNEALLIEDNAHGLFGRDSSGLLLGTRGDMGILSMRKSLPLPDGAALLVNNPRLFPSSPVQLPSNDKAEPIRFLAKQGVRRIAHKSGSGPAYAAIRLFHALRAASTGVQIPISLVESERRMPAESKPCKNLARYLSCVEPLRELARRRNLYAMLDEKFRKCNLAPLMTDLPLGAAPYCYAYVAEPTQVSQIMPLLRTLRLNCHRWPDLPSQLEAAPPSWQKHVWTVAFLW